MKLKERRYNLVIHKVREWLLDSSSEIGATIHTDKIKRGITEFAKEEINGAIKHLMGKEYLDPCDETDKSTLERIKLTSKGIEEWIFPEGYDNQKRIFLSHASEDKKLAGQIKEGLEQMGFEIFIAHEDIPGTVEWRDRIIAELSTCGIFFALRTKTYNGKPYTEQECGFALAFKKRILTIFVETNPGDAGFCEAFQGKKFQITDIEDIMKYCTKQLL